MAERFPHPRGLVCFDLFWRLGNPHLGVHVLEVSIKGDGPWKIGESVVRVLGCHGTDAALARRFDEWRAYIAAHADTYPARTEIEAIARHHARLSDRRPRHLTCSMAPDRHRQRNRLLELAGEIIRLTPRLAGHHGLTGGFIQWPLTHFGEKQNDRRPELRMRYSSDRGNTHNRIFHFGLRWWE